jgi:hypothetical protein
MVHKTRYRWALQPSSVVGLGVLAGSVCYLVTGDPIWASVTAAAVKMLVPDNSAPASELLEAIATLAKPVDRLPEALPQQLPVASGGRGCNPASPHRAQSEE